MSAFVVSSYTGNGADNRAITGVGFQPVMVWIIRRDTGRQTWKTSSMSGDTAMDWQGNSGLVANLIQSLDADGFTVGTDTTVNGNTFTYDYIAFPSDSSLVVGTYVGNGIDSTDISIGTSWTPAFVLTQRVTAGLAAQVWYSTKGGDNAHSMDSATAWQSDRLQTVGAGSFQVGSSGFTNLNATDFYYCAFEEAGGKFDVGTYTGDGLDDRNITQGTAFAPSFVMTQSNRNAVTVDGGTFRRHSSMPVGTSVSNTASVANAVQDFFASGFQVGNHNDVNANTIVYYYFSVGPGTTPATLTLPTIPEIPSGVGMSQLPFAPYQRYKNVRAAVAQYNNLVLGP